MMQRSLNLRLLGLIAFALTGIADLRSESAPFQVARLPEQGIQPRSSRISPEVVYLQGRPDAADVKLGRLDVQGHWLTLLTLNTPDTQAVGMGTVRGPALAVSHGGTRHAVWHGKNGTARGGKGSALYYSRIDASDRVSRPQNMMGVTTALDGGAAVVAGEAGKVWLVWHALPPGGEGETGRRLFIRRSTDDGLTFSEPWAVTGEDYGVCACCGLAATLGGDGHLYVLYRSAEERRGRGIRLLQLSADADASTKPTVVQHDLWELEGCPMTTADLLPTAGGVVPVWVNQFKLASSLAALPAMAVAGRKSQTGQAPLNHPRVVTTAAGERLLLWTEGAAWGKGGRLFARRFASAGEPLGEVWSQALPVWSYGAAVTLPDGRLVVTY